MFVNIFFASLRFLLLASRFVKRKSPCLLNVRYFLLLVFISITTFSLSCIYYIILLRICQGFFKTFFKFLKPYYEGGILDASALPFPLDTIYYIRLTADYNSQNAQISGENFVQNNQIKMLDKL